jgi:hypothetical protein
MADSSEAAAEEDPMALTFLDSESEQDETEDVALQEGLLSFSTPSASSTQPTISTLGTEGNEDEQLPPLKSVFHCQNIYTQIVNDSKEG